ncbi:MAG: HEAT repeat domain-containing protein [Gemmataceae bacterium]|nr:HEAT repeat domain-containing protein [Gemmataceae bacterium]
MGRSALHVAFRAIDGFRSGIQPHLVLESQVGELVEMVWDHRPTGPAPLHVRVLVESLRLLRREASFRFALRDEPAEQEAINWQLARIAALEPEIRDFLKNQSEILLPVLPSMAGQELTDSLQALNDMRVDAARELMALLPNVLEQRGLMIEVLRWSRDSRVGPWLCDCARANVAMEKRAKRRAVADVPRQSTVPAAFPYVEILLSLRGHPSVETEPFLLIAAQDWDPRIRMSAVSSLGWWEPIVGAAVRACLVQYKRDPCPEVSQTARAALARLGERGSLHWFRQTLFSDDTRQVIEASLLIARECLTLLWPDLDRLVDSDNSDIALHASEAIQCLAEEMEQSRSWTM